METCLQSPSDTNIINTQMIKMNCIGKVSFVFKSPPPPGPYRKLRPNRLDGPHLHGAGRRPPLRDNSLLQAVPHAAGAALLHPKRQIYNDLGEIHLTNLV